MIDKLRDSFFAAGGTIPEKVRATCGWPSVGGKAEKNRRIGECWDSERSGDQHFEIFISPLVDDGAEVGAVLVHELVHCCVGIDAGHKAPFKKLALAVNLEGKMTATVPSEELVAELEMIIDEIGPYPHAKLTFSDKPKKQGTRMLKVTCPDPGCGWSARTTQKWIDVGLPTCVCGTVMEVEVKEEDEGEGGDE
jgi:hypothetical protein